MKQDIFDKEMEKLTGLYASFDKGIWNKIKNNIVSNGMAVSAEEFKKYINGRQFSKIFGGDFENKYLIYTLYYWLTVYVLEIPDLKRFLWNESRVFKEKKLTADNLALYMIGYRYENMIKWLKGEKNKKGFDYDINTLIKVNSNNFEYYVSKKPKKVVRVSMNMSNALDKDGVNIDDDVLIKGQRIKQEKHSSMGKTTKNSLVNFDPSDIKMKFFKVPPSVGCEGREFFRSEAFLDIGVEWNYGVFMSFLAEWKKFLKAECGYTAKEIQSINHEEVFKKNEEKAVVWLRDTIECLKNRTNKSVVKGGEGKHCIYGNKGNIDITVEKWQEILQITRENEISLTLGVTNQLFGED